MQPSDILRGDSGISPGEFPSEQHAIRIPPCRWKPAWMLTECLMLVRKSPADMQLVPLQGTGKLDLTLWAWAMKGLAWVACSQSSS